MSENNIPSIEPLRIGLNAIESHSKKMDKWHTTFEEMFDGHPVYEGDNELISAIIDILKVHYKEEYDDDIISWWIYEKEFGKRKDFKMYEKGGEVEIPSDTVEDLYNYLIRFNFNKEK